MSNGQWNVYRWTRIQLNSQVMYVTCILTGSMFGSKLRIKSSLLLLTGWKQSLHWQLSLSQLNENSDVSLFIKHTFNTRFCLSKVMLSIFLVRSTQDYSKFCWSRWCWEENTWLVHLLSHLWQLTYVLQLCCCRVEINWGIMSRERYKDKCMSHMIVFFCDVF